MKPPTADPARPDRAAAAAATTAAPGNGPGTAARYRAAHHSRGAIVGLPAQGSAYTDSLYAVVRNRGGNVRDGIWSGRWLLANVGRDDTLHLHWPSFQYYDPHSRAGSLLGLARFVLICSLLRLRGTRILWTAHNLYPHDGGRSLWLHRVARRFVVLVAERILVHGPTAAASVRKEFALGSERVRLTPHGHWIGAFPDGMSRAAARASLQLPPDARVFVFFGLCKPYKGLEALIDAVAALPVEAHLVIAGKFFSGEYQAAIEHRAQSAAGGRIRVHPGYVPDEQVQRYLKAADAVVLPYREILTSGAAMLAMSFGRPVIGPRRGSLLDVVPEQCGILYDDRSPGGLQTALQTALQARFDSGTIRAHVSAYTWEAAADVLIDEHEREAAAQRDRP